MMNYFKILPFLCLSVLISHVNCYDTSGLARADSLNNWSSDWPTNGPTNGPTDGPTNGPTTTTTNPTTARPGGPCPDGWIDAVEGCFLLHYTGVSWKVS